MGGCTIHSLVMDQETGVDSSWKNLGPLIWSICS